MDRLREDAEVLSSGTNSEAEVLSLGKSSAPGTPELVRREELIKEKVKL